jgi:hypothetical protein
MLTHQPPELAEMTLDQLRAWRGVSRLGWILRLDEVLAIRPPPPRKRAKRPRIELAPHIAPSYRKSASSSALQNLKSWQKPDPLPPPAKRHSSGSGGVDKFFGREESSRGQGHGVRGAPLVMQTTLTGSAPRVVAQHSGHRAGQRGDMARGVPGNHQRGQVGGSSRGGGYRGHEHRVHSNSSGRNHSYRWKQGMGLILLD